MAIKVITEFIRKGTVRIIAYVYDDDGDLVDATGLDVSIKDPSGTLVIDEVAMTDKIATGAYEYYYTTTTAVVVGNYRYEIDVLDGSYHTYAHGHFRMTAGINE